MKNRLRWVCRACVAVLWIPFLPMRSYRHPLIPLVPVWLGAVVFAVVLLLAVDVLVLGDRFRVRVLPWQTIPDDKQPVTLDLNKPD